MKMIGQLGALVEAFRKGKSVSNPEAWKKGQITVTALAPFMISLVGVAEVFGYKLPISNEQVLTIAGGIIAVVNIVCTLVSTEKIGVGKESLPPSSLASLESEGFGTEWSDKEPTRAAQGYERVGTSSTDRTGN